mmetsp:Transcript_51472/g.137695  ORF Transcript_51472/g.137695 Transcript_51472/m.137695 type:complete len:231 (-) Transcript_51472:54-746(-)
MEVLIRIPQHRQEVVEALHGAVHHRVQLLGELQLAGAAQALLDAACRLMHQEAERLPLGPRRSDDLVRLPLELREDGGVRHGQGVVQLRVEPRLLRHRELEELVGLLLHEVQDVVECGRNLLPGVAGNLVHLLANLVHLLGGLVHDLPNLVGDTLHAVLHLSPDLLEVRELLLEVLLPLLLVLLEGRRSRRLLQQAGEVLEGGRCMPATSGPCQRRDEEQHARHHPRHYG